jgi:hypothetical protein
VPEAVVPEPRAPVAESRLREGEVETEGREPDPGGRRLESGWGEHVPAEPEPEQAWREADPGGPEPLPGESKSGQARREPDRGGRMPDFAGREHVPVEPEPDQAWREADWAGPKPDSVWREQDPAESPAWREPDPPWHEADPFPGVAVVLADPRGLRRIIGQHNRWRTVWSADDVLDACYALSLAHLAPPRSALLADGFPARLPAFSRLPELPAVVPVPPDPPIPAADDDPGPRSARSRGPAVFPRPRPIRQVPWGLVFVLTLLVTVGVIAAVFVAQVFHGS